MRELLFLGLLFMSLNSLGQSLSPYFTRTRTLQLEGYSSTGVNIPYSYSGGSVSSVTVNDSAFHAWLDERIAQWVSENEIQGIDSARVYDSLSVHRDSIDDISSYAHSLSQDFLPLSGNATMSGAQTFTLGSGAFVLSQGNTGTHDITIQNTLDNSGNIRFINSNTSQHELRVEDTHVLITSSPFEEAKLRFENDASNGGVIKYVEDSGKFLVRNFADSGYENIQFANPVTPKDGANKEYVDAAVEGGGVSEAYVATSIDSVDNASEIGYTPATTGDWPNADPTTVQGGLDSLAERVTYIEGILPGIIDTVNLNSWDMDASSTLNVTLPVTNANLIAVLDVVIFHDNGTVSVRKWNRVSSAGTVDIGAADLQTLSSTTFQLVRGTDGYFDANGTFYDDTGVNRGYMVIFYRE